MTAVPASVDVATLKSLKSLADHPLCADLHQQYQGLRQRLRETEQKQQTARRELPASPSRVGRVLWWSVRLSGSWRN